MNTRTRLVLAAAALFSTTVALGSAWQPEAGRPAGEGQPEGGRPGRPGGRPGGRQQASLDAGMKGMNRALVQLGGHAADMTKRDENLRLLGDLQRSAVVAKSAPLPESVTMAAKDEAGKAKIANDVRKRLIQIVRLALDAEQDIMDGKGADAQKKLDQIADLRDEGHKAMGISDEE